MTRLCPHPISVAPMMDVTDRHTRWLYRRISRRVLLYTEMVTATALAHGDVPTLLDFDPSEHPVALQLGGDDLQLMAEAARLGERWGYDEINLNIGCPSPRVQRGRFGACLMLDPDHVAKLVRAVRRVVEVPVTVKCRIGVDDHDRYEDLLSFAAAMRDAGADRLTVHARKAWLDGLSPKENREIPPLRYEDVYRLKHDLPDLPIEINGGITTLDEADDHLERVDAVMIGRAVWRDPWLLADVDRRYGAPDATPPTREAVARDFADYARAAIARGARPQHVLRNLAPLFSGQPGSGAFKRTLSEAHHCGVDAVARGLDAMAQVRDRMSHDVHSVAEAP
jgi:tRNA-dihydrouridine synthase A